MKNSVEKISKTFSIFNEKIEIREWCKGVHCVDLGESFPTSIYLQKSASIQPRTSPSKFGGKYSILFTGVLSEHARGEGRSGESLPPPTCPLEQFTLCARVPQNVRHLETTHLSTHYTNRKGETTLAELGGRLSQLSSKAILRTLSG